ncbi:hypothetical protein D3C77_448600 [compost metagenome]
MVRIRNNRTLCFPKTTFCIDNTSRDHPMININALLSILASFQLPVLNTLTISCRAITIYSVNQARFSPFPYIPIITIATYPRGRMIFNPNGKLKQPVMSRQIESPINHFTMRISLPSVSSINGINHSIKMPLRSSATTKRLTTYRDGDDSGTCILNTSCL